jgi:GT2 family glycosyltransferase
MIDQFVDDSVGAVGCKLLYPNGNIQFGGVGLHHSINANKHNWYHIDQPRHHSEGLLSNLTFEAQCLTAACMMIRFDLAKSIGLFNENSYPIGFSDVDLSLRIRQAGFNLIYTGKAKAVHHESISRGLGYPDDMEGILLQQKLENLTYEVY